MGRILESLAATHNPSISKIYILVILIFTGLFNKSVELTGFSANYNNSETSPLEIMSSKISLIGKFSS